MHELSCSLTKIKTTKRSTFLTEPFAYWFSLWTRWKIRQEKFDSSYPLLCAKSLYMDIEWINSKCRFLYGVRNDKLFTPELERRKYLYSLFYTDTEVMKTVNLWYKVYVKSRNKTSKTKATKQNSWLHTINPAKLLIKIEKNFTIDFFSFRPV